MQYREQKIRVRAHQIWVEEDCPGGRDVEHWERATREIDADGRAAEKQAANGRNHLPSQTTDGPGQSVRASEPAPSVASSSEPPELPAPGNVPANDSQGGVNGEGS